MAVSVQFPPERAAQEFASEGALLVDTGSVDPEPFRITVRAGDGWLRILLRGELDLAGVDLLDEVVGVAQAAQVPFIVDCGGLTFVDSTGVGSLRRAARRGAGIDGVHVRVQRVLDIVGFHAGVDAP